MLLSKEKIITAYYYIALIAFALSACAVMFEQESSGGIAYTNFIIAFAFRYRQRLLYFLIFT